MYLKDSDKQKLLDQKWKNSNMIKCGSLSEFILRLDVSSIKIDYFDFIYLSEYAAINFEFCQIMIQLIKTTKLLDNFLFKLNFYSDFYLAISENKNPDPLKFGRIEIIELYQAGFFKIKNSIFEKYILVCINKINNFFENKLEHTFNLKITQFN